MGIATSAEQTALARSVLDWAQRAEPRQQAHLPHDQLRAGRQQLWPQVAGLGLIAAAVPERLGGVSGTVLDTAVALEACAHVLAPGAVLPTALTALILSRHPDSVPARAHTGALAEGEYCAAVALGGSPLPAREGPEGTLTVSGTVAAVPGAGDAALLLIPVSLPGQLPGEQQPGAEQAADAEHWAVLPSDTEGLQVLDGTAFDLTVGAATVQLSDVRIAADQVLSTEPGSVLDLAAVLAAAEAAGVAAWTLATATDYARVREQFGRAIGSFQAVKHLCAQMLCRREQAVAVAWDAARAQDEGHAAQAQVAAAVAGAVALDAALANALDCIQVLGGIGFTYEHDAHLYLRRAQALRQWLGGTATWQARAARLTREGTRRVLSLPTDQQLPTEQAEPVLDGFRQQVRAALAALPSSDPERRAALADSGYLVPHWPAPYGLGASAREQLVIEDELTRAGIAQPDLGIAAWAVPTIVLHGNEQQQERFVTPSLRGEIVWCQLFSEPEAGSDLASLRTRAERREGGWVLTGQKVWTSLAHVADWAICLARTDPDAPRHAGLTYFLVDMRSPGIDARPLPEMTGEALFNEVFLTEVFVPDECVVGEVNGGWKLARATLAQERVSMGGGSALGRGLENLLGMKERDLLGDERLGALIGTGTSVSLIGLLGTARRLAAESSGARPAPGPESSVVKLLGVRHRQEVAQTAFELLGPAALIDADDTHDALHQVLLTRCLSIAGGTTQILLNVAAERLLGLPREPSGGKA